MLGSQKNMLKIKTNHVLCRIHFCIKNSTCNDSVPAGAVLVLKMRIKCSMVATPYPHYAAQLFHEQHLQNKFGIQIC